MKRLLAIAALLLTSCAGAGMRAHGTVKGEAFWATTGDTTVLVYSGEGQMVAGLFYMRWPLPEWPMPGVYIKSGQLGIDEARRLGEPMPLEWEATIKDAIYPARPDELGLVFEERPTK